MYYRKTSGDFAGIADDSASVPNDWIATPGKNAFDTTCVWNGTDWALTEETRSNIRLGIDQSYCDAVDHLLAFQPGLLVTYIAIGVDISAYEAAGYNASNVPPPGTVPWIQALVGVAGATVHDCYLAAKQDKAAWESIVPKWNAKRLKAKEMTRSAITTDDANNVLEYAVFS